MADKLLEQSLSIVMPVYNEAGNIEIVIRDFYAKIINAVAYDVEFIIAEDGSDDGTKEILSNLNSEFPFILISTPERKGYTRSFKDALKRSTKSIVFFSDSDGQHTPTDFFKLLKEIETCDIVSGYKFKRQDPFYRVMISRVYNFIFFVIFGFKVKDINSGFKLIRRNVIDNVLNSVNTLRYCVMSEFILRSHLAGYKIKEVPVLHYSSRNGRSAIFSPLKLPLIIAGILAGLLKIKFERKKVYTHE